MLIEKLDRSPHRRVRFAALAEVRLHAGVLRRRMDINIHETIPHCDRMLAETGVYEGFELAAGRRPGTARGYWFRDEHLYKWLEGVALALHGDGTPELQRLAAQAIDLITTTQQPDGYLNTGYTCSGRARWTDLAMGHEIYCAGTLIEAGIAHRRATGAEPLFAAACNLADLLCATFGPTGLRGACGHPEAEVALVELYRETGAQRYLDLARFFIDVRGSRPPVCGGKPYMQDHLPFREQHQAVGHAVRALYLYGGATDVYLETGDRTLLDTVDLLWDDVHRGKVYVTGGLGARYNDEDFGEAYELPNVRAYCETCAAIAYMRWAKRLFAVRPEARYIDAVEHALYNGFLAGIGLSGREFFYMNPLESHGTYARIPWHSCPCCPPNDVRTIAQLPSYLYAVGPQALYLNLYHASEFDGHLLDGRRVTLRTETDYPWSGDVRITLGAAAGTFALCMRVPGWCSGASVRVNGTPVAAGAPGSYVQVERPWRAGDRIELQLPMPVQALEAHPLASNLRGATALRRGPQVYCFESPDNPGADLTVARLKLHAARPDHGVQARFDANLLGGTTVLDVPGEVEPSPASERPAYVPRTGAAHPARSVTLRAVPYALWANRGPATMYVWVPTDFD